MIDITCLVPYIFTQLLIFEKKEMSNGMQFMQEALCLFPGCTLPARHKGLCNSLTTGPRARSSLIVESPVQKGDANTHIRDMCK